MWRQKLGKPRGVADPAGAHEVNRSILSLYIMARKPLLQHALLIETPEPWLSPQHHGGLFRERAPAVDQGFQHEPFVRSGLIERTQESEHNVLNVESHAVALQDTVQLTEIELGLVVPQVPKYRPHLGPAEQLLLSEVRNVSRDTPRSSQSRANT